MSRSRSFSAATLARLVLGLLFAGLIAPDLRGQDSIEVWGSTYGLVDAPTGSEFTQVVSGRDFCVALRTDGSIAAWGANNNNQVSSAPAGTNFVQVAAGPYSSLALRGNGTIVAWPWEFPDMPVGGGFTQIACGFRHFQALRADGSIVSWGLDTYGQLSNAPTGTGFVEIAAGTDHSVARRADGSIVSWGRDTSGQSSGAPSGTGFVAVAAGESGSLALRADGSIAAWGFSYWDAPTGTGFTQIAVGTAHSIALRADGSVVAWGSDTYQQLSAIHGGTGFVEIAAGGFHSVALRAPGAGQPFCFGDGSGWFCPCDRYGLHGRGCGGPNIGGGTRLIGFGTPSLGTDSFGLFVTGTYGGQPGLILQGANALNGGLGNPVGDGLLCTGGPMARSQVQVAPISGNVTFEQFRGAPFGVSSFGVGVPTNYQYWYRVPSPESCTGAAFNFSNAWTVTWTP